MTLRYQANGLIEPACFTSLYHALATSHEAILLASDANDLYQRVCSLLSDAGAFDAAAILMVAQPSSELIVVAVEGTLPNGRVQQECEMTLAETQAAIDAHCSKQTTVISVSPTQSQAVAAIPIVQHHLVTGILLLKTKAIIKFDAALLRCLELMARAIAQKLDQLAQLVTYANDQRNMVRLQNMFAALSATNEAILRTKAPEELYQRVCDAAVNNGKFTTTMILKPNPDSGWMEIQAMTSVGEDMMRNYRMSIDAALPEGQGTVGTAYRSGKSSLRNNMVSDPRMTPWRERAVKAGIAAVAAVPLLREGKAVGVILFHSREAAAFDEETVELLERMAENVVFAIDNFEREAERKLGEERIQFLATHDVLTGLPNRVMFSHVLNVTLEAAKRYRRRFALLFIDLDRFKFINDTLGHEAGDTLLKEIAARFKQTLRSSDAIARLGGDEFVLLIQEMNNSDQAEIVARKILASAIEPMMLAGQECQISASIGIAMFPEDGGDEQTLTKSADVAMYHAKQEGKNNYQFYSQDIKTHSAQRIALESNLRLAMERNELSLHYQPKIDLNAGAITGVEALLRWNSPVMGLVPPAQFLAIAEETGSIVPIGLWVLRTACSQNVAWQNEGLPSLRVAVNLSVRQLSDDSLLRNIALILDETGMAPELLELEITESMVIENPENTIKFLTAIKQMGVRVAIDDFGTATMLLRELKHFPIDTLKVHRSVVGDLANKAEDQAIAQSMIAMGKSLSVTVVAKGVETVEQQNFLRDHYCDQMQGFYFSEPLPAAELAALLRQYVK